MVHCIPEVPCNAPGLYPQPVSGLRHLAGDAGRHIQFYIASGLWARERKHQVGAYLEFHVALQASEYNRAGGVGHLAGDAGCEGAIQQLCVFMGCLSHDIAFDSFPLNVLDVKHI